VFPEVVEGQMKSPRVTVVVLVLVFCFLLPVALRARQERARAAQVIGARQALLDTVAPPPPQPVDKRTLDARNQLEQRMNVQRLYALATELKEEMEQTNSSMELNARVVRRARDIEKLAKQIKDSARR
jgi:hypothetical protein